MSESQTTSRPSQVAYMGFGLGAGSALLAAQRDPDAQKIVLAFTSLELGSKVATEPRVAGWLGLTDPKLRELVADQVQCLLPNAIESDLGKPALLYLGLEGEQHLSVAAQKQLIAQLQEQLPALESWWHDGSLRSLARDTDRVAGRIVDFLMR